MLSEGVSSNLHAEEAMLFLRSCASTARRAFLWREFPAARDLESIRRPEIADAHPRHEVTENGSMLEQMARTSAGQQDIGVPRVPIDDEVRVGCQNDLVEL